jgi:hypothetical protein
VKNKNYNKTPFLATWLLKRMSVYEKKHSIIGDFEEHFKRIAKEKNRINATGWYWLQVLLTFPEYFKLQTVMGTIMFKNYLTQITYKETSNIEKKVMYADSNFFNIFTNPLMISDPKTVLQRPYSVVITNETAKKYSGLISQTIDRTISV